MRPNLDVDVRRPKVRRLLEHLREVGMVVGANLVHGTPRAGAAATFGFGVELTKGVRTDQPARLDPQFLACCCLLHLSDERGEGVAAIDEETAVLEQRKGVVRLKRDGDRPVGHGEDPARETRKDLFLLHRLAVPGGLTRVLGTQRVETRKGAIGSGTKRKGVSKRRAHQGFPLRISGTDLHDPARGSGSGC